MTSGVVLGFDSATPRLTVAALAGKDVLYEHADEPAAGERPAHARELLTRLEEAARAAGGWDAVATLAVGIGPGSYTGLRIGIATARALAQALGTPVRAVVSLDALAAGIRRAAPGEELVLAVLDARRSQVFGALYEGGARLWEPFVAAPGELAQRVAQLGREPFCGGDGSVRFRGQLEAAGARILADGDEGHLIAARDICATAEGLEPSEPGAIEPIYLRPPDAEMWREEQRRKSDGK
jgi:tRNA threonylcarbamoyladenosine biosynthesis protein TsaB